MGAECVSLPDAQEQAARFARVRTAHRTETQEDYVELIADLIADAGEARATDLAERLGVTPATVANTLNRLKRDGLVEMRPYRSIFLTPVGTEMAAKAKARHELVVAFLRALGVSEAVAEMDAEGLEHHLSEETLAAMRGFAGGGYCARARR
ncbi:manganese-binding transcriptional regulator MntR [Sphingomonas sp. SUN019]|uniref:manganese-binding transcriptional regulator MntR n=1 Tax=Sphingomonas sp. SUN019 TaxID=2937788 RepID=UPI0021647524|nr:manganese-binding transcriptional regulator MntR [Sphingomonas sp. SUN019]UVO51432.1 manganese-binding transcriptional regulator MntR [Sphingomonas sp. SUN019]